MDSVLDSMKRLVQATVDGFNTWDYEALRATRSDDFTYQYLPTTLTAPPRNNEEYGEFFKAQLTPLFTKFVAKPTTITHDPEARRSVMFADVDVDSIAGEAPIEIVMMLGFNEAGDKITRIDEFFDSLTYTNFFLKAAAMQAEAAGKGEK